MTADILMIKKAAATALDILTPTQFENLIFDLMVLRGMSNVHWRTPGADGGRDIEGETSVVDFSGYQRTEKWFVECKNYSSAIGWPLVYEKIAHADAAAADVLLMCTQSTFSPTAISRAQEWNNRQGSVKVRLWPRHDLELRLGEHPDLQIKYGISANNHQSGSSITRLVLTIYKALTSYDANREYASRPAERMFEAALEISSLVHKKMEDIELRGKVSSSELKSEDNDFVQIKVDGYCRLDRHGVKAYAHLLAALSSSKVTVQSDGKDKCVVHSDGSHNLTDVIRRHSGSFNSICFWSNFDASVMDGEIKLVQREDL